MRVSGWSVSEAQRRAAGETRREVTEGGQQAKRAGSRGRRRLYSTVP